MTTGAVLLNLPGLGNSGEDHWQTHWERRDRGAIRLIQDEWRSPKCRDWVSRLEEFLSNRGGQFVISAHSSACVMVAHWVLNSDAPSVGAVRAALLVAPSDPEAPGYPKGPSGFAPVPLARLPFPTHLVYSSNDPTVTPSRARAFGAAWGSRLTELQNAGHIEPRSGFGPWGQGFAFVEELRRMG